MTFFQKDRVETLEKTVDVSHSLGVDIIRTGKMKEILSTLEAKLIQLDKFEKNKKLVYLRFSLLSL